MIIGKKFDNKSDIDTYYAYMCDKIKKAKDVKSLLYIDGELYETFSLNNLPINSKITPNELLKIIEEHKCIGYYKYLDYYCFDIASMVRPDSIIEVINKFSIKLDDNFVMLYSVNNINLKCN